VALRQARERYSADASPALLRLAWSSVAAFAIAPLQDILNLGNDARMNQPGRAEGNWRWRYTEDMLSESAFQSLQELTHASARTGGLETPRADAKPLTHDLPALQSPEMTR
jgi:4-alpha-glucanotransferase